MNTDQAFEVHAAMRQHGIAGTVTPVTPDNPGSTWIVLDADGRDVTGSVLARVAAARGWRSERGFVVAR
ncbi:hypothetical protein AVW11_01820 [Streptomyces amritsarensis]|uniref:Uncharacterized protein n=1 Tax=Streptomyces amritsarensis TaxID=681158 RepID=A0ABX3GBL5_9ACTN|nr:hypothetical protein [Streptomyces amritsarensis]OLZ73834.1 hypothetical protein AVW11_01820 [Streptomyces amritsarensis]